MVAALPDSGSESGKMTHRKRTKRTEKRNFYTTEIPINWTWIGSLRSKSFNNWFKNLPKWVDWFSKWFSIDFEAAGRPQDCFRSYQTWIPINWTWIEHELGRYAQNLSIIDSKIFQNELIDFQNDFLLILRPQADHKTVFVVIEHELSWIEHELNMNDS